MWKLKLGQLNLLCGCWNLEDFIEEEELWFGQRRVVQASKTAVNRDRNLGPIQRMDGWVGCGGREAGYEARIRLHRAWNSRLKKMGSNQRLGFTSLGHVYWGVSQSDHGYEKPQVNVAYHLDCQFYSKAWGKSNLVFSFKRCIRELNIKS